MNVLRFILFGFGVVMLFIACGNENEALYLEAPHNKYIICRGSALYLNDGKKWKSNKETTEGIHGMLERMEKFPLDADTSAYHKLAGELIQDYIYIVNYCAWMGDNHEMVHAYLFPLHELIVPMQISGEITCKNQFQKIKEHLDLYGVYFE